MYVYFPVSSRQLALVQNLILLIITRFIIVVMMKIFLKLIEFDESVGGYSLTLICKLVSHVSSSLLQNYNLGLPLMYV